MPASQQSFVHRVRGHLEALPATERQLASFLLEFPGELASYAGNELAELAGVSPSTVSRFIRRIGPSHLARQFAVRHADIAGSGLPKRDDSNERFEARVWAEVERKPAFSIADLAIDGDDVMQTMIARRAAPPGFRGDRRVGELLQWLFEQVTEVPERNERQTLLTLLAEHLSASGTIG